MDHLKARDVMMLLMTHLDKEILGMCPGETGHKRLSSRQ